MHWPVVTGSSYEGLAFLKRKRRRREPDAIRTGETIQIAASRRATFRPSKELKERLNGKREAAQEINA